MSHGSPVALELQVRGLRSVGVVGEWGHKVLLGLTYRAQGLSTAVSSLKVCSKL